MGETGDLRVAKGCRASGERRYDAERRNEGWLERSVVARVSYVGYRRSGVQTGRSGFAAEVRVAVRGGEPGLRAVGVSF